MRNRSFKTFFLFYFFCVPFLLSAEEFTSSSFTVLDPVINPAEYSTSTSFSLWSTMAEIGVGTSTASSYSLGGGFLRFPYATTPTITATAGTGQVALSWTASDGFQGWNTSAYSVGQSTVSGGPYTYTNVGGVLSSTRTGLTGGTPYYFVVVALDAFNNQIATSSEVSSTPTTASSGGGGGGGGGSSGSVGTSAKFIGRAYPKSTVTLLKDAQVVATTIAGADANFQITVSSITAGNYIFSLYSEDKNGRRSGLLTFPVSITEGATTNITGIFIAPTISTDKSEVKKGDNIVIFGQSVPQSDIIISVNSEEEFFSKTISDKDGIYLYNFDSVVLELGTHSTRSKASIGNQVVSGFSPTVNFKVGNKNVFVDEVSKCPAKADLNNDCRVNLVDFSIAAFWYRKPLSDAFKLVESSKLNADGKIDLTDFSIMAFYWTG